MPINGSEFIDNPSSTIFSTFTDLMGNTFWLIPLSFITVALFVKTRNPVAASGFMIASGLILGSGNIFVNNPQMAYVYWIFAALGAVGIILGVFFHKI
jgi:hypothetical protein